MASVTTTENATGSLLEAMLPRAIGLVGQFLEADLGGVAELIDEGASLKTSIAPTQAQKREPWVNVSSLNAEDSANAYALEQGSAIVVSDLETEQRFEDPFLGQLEIIRVMIVPIVVSDKVVGTLGAYWTRPRTFLPEDVQAAEAIARLLSAGISRARVGGGEEDPTDAARKKSPAEPGHYDYSASEGDKKTMGDDYRYSATPSGGEDKAYEYGSTESAGGAEGKGYEYGAAQPTGEPAAEGVPASEHVGKNRRRSARAPFRKWQSIAPLYGGVLPTLQQFFKVECCDLSNGGVSLYLPLSPQFDSLVICLGEPPDVNYYTARVVRVTPQQRDGREVYQLGCQFMGRIYL